MHFSVLRIKRIGLARTKKTSGQQSITAGVTPPGEANVWLIRPVALPSADWGTARSLSLILAARRPPITVVCTGTARSRRPADVSWWGPAVEARDTPRSCAVEQGREKIGETRPGKGTPNQGGQQTVILSV